MKWFLFILIGIWTFAGAQSQDLDATYRALMQTLKTRPCNAKALERLEPIGVQWLNDPGKQADDLAIWEILNHCKPHNSDILYYLGVQLSRAGRWDEAQAALKECLSLAPEYADAEVQLGLLYLWQGREDLAKGIFERFPENSDAQMALARIHQKAGDHQHSNELYRRVIEKNPKNLEARQNLAKSSAAWMNFSEAKSQYQWLVANDPNSEGHWAEFFDVKSHTDLAVFLETDYTDAKESDPSLDAPVVKDYYFFNAVHFLIPVFDRWRLDLSQIYYHQRENDIYPPIGVNYSMFSAGANLTSSFLFKKDWKWDLYVRGFEAWGDQRVNYPFRRTTRFEPGTSLLYNSERQIFALDTHRESFVIKNFAAMRSEILWTDYLTGIYGYRFAWRLNPELQAQISQIFIQGDNWESTQTLLASCKLPFIKYFTALYRFDHGHFDQLNPNYYSFMQQYMNTIGVRLHYDLHSRAVFELIYEHRWKTTYKLFQPIGNFIFVAAKQSLFSNKVIARMNIRYKDTLRLMIEGHYFYETLPYNDWNVNGSILWQF
ncbi:MAG: hypothetical protein HW387_1449 [Parachlamydiales bacterium]|nr:hypothetical protein [Parachlamydiales bacterium]